MTIRTGNRADIPTIVAFQQQMALETENLQLAENTLMAGVSRIFDEPYRGQYWLAASDGKTIASLLTLSEWSDWRNGEVIWVHSVYVLPEYRGKGVFTAMYRKLRAWVEENEHLKGLRLYVEKQNHRAQRVYRKVGMDDQHYDMYEWLKS